MLRFGCQTYPWKMSNKDYVGNVSHMLQIAKKAGFKAFEAEIDMLGDYYNKPDEFKELLKENDLEFSTLVLHQSWKNKNQTQEEKEFSMKAIKFASMFRGAKIMVSHHAKQEIRPQGDELFIRRSNLISCMSEVANIAGEYGIVTCVHPNSAKNSLFKTSEDYKVFFEFLYKTDLGWAPDIGHIVNGNIEPLQLLKTARDKIRHVHCKDRISENTWAVMGEGTIDYPAIFDYLKQTLYKGWLIVEDESVLALTDPDKTVLMDGNYFKNF